MFTIFDVINVIRVAARASLATAQHSRVALAHITPEQAAEEVAQFDGFAYEVKENEGAYSLVFRDSLTHDFDLSNETSLFDEVNESKLVGAGVAVAAHYLLSRELV